MSTYVREKVLRIPTTHLNMDHIKNVLAAKYKNYEDDFSFYLESEFPELFDYGAIGAGEDFATAALYLGHHPKEAVKVACDLSCYVCEPIIEYKMAKENNQ